MTLAEWVKLLGNPLAQNVAFVAVVFVGLALVLSYVKKRDAETREAIEKELVKPLVARLNDLEWRIQTCCVHLLRAIALASKHNDQDLDHELLLAATALSKRSEGPDGP